ncbi:transporter substrate-binding domain-containing protein [Bacteriovorax sp. PP10]|uniref:Transporter substrate-binding domain-containing protein n=1 Tax=Bacteriovorax antarcticus TaxID=3088717 RepID=A0ABU5VSV9_9BACT|nr:transporter substrate-binding domain-containing protein [Bacteriovorax sp. PP10]MEA9355682.1 transporter substrate-binding domain-containing protein [Bacteriovorax sp. PP10]
MQIRIYALKFFFLLALIFSAPIVSGNTQPIVVKIGGYEFAPFIEKEGKEGIVKDLIAKLNASQEKYHFEFVLTSANRRYRDFKTQKYDIILFEDEAWSWKQMGINYARTSIIGSGKELAVAMNYETRDQSYFDNLADKKIEVVLGYHYQITDMKSDAQTLMNKKIVQGKSNQDNLEDLLSKKVDVTFINSLMLSRFLNKNKELKDKFLIRNKVDHQFALRGLIHPNSPIKVSELEKLGFNKILVTDEN